ncbi:hypothetical protein G6F58_013476 [Rhizopus delemar]|nr:hypothetical protein G6F58_013476 [Rhizopus delemar]
MTVSGRSHRRLHPASARAHEGWGFRRRCQRAAGRARAGHGLERIHLDAAAASGDTARAQPPGLSQHGGLDRHVVDRVRRDEPDTGFAGGLGDHPQPDPSAGGGGEAGQIGRARV